MSNYAIKLNLKNTTGVERSKLAAKSYLTSLKAKVDQRDIEKLTDVPINLSKLRNIIKKKVAKKIIIIMINYLESK